MSKDLKVREYTKDSLLKEEGSLKVWWIPQIPMPCFEHRVSNVEEAQSVLRCLANYDQFQLDNNIKPDYSNTGGLLVWEDYGEGPEWVEWEDPKTGENIDF